MKQEIKDIYNFKKGDIITRIESLKNESSALSFFHNFGSFSENNSFIGEKLIFLGIANGCIYLSKNSDIISRVLTGTKKIIIQLPLNLWSNGWSLYEEPDFLKDINIEDNEISDISNIIDEVEIEREIKKSIDNELFEKADFLKKKLEEIKKRKRPKKE